MSTLSAVRSNAQANWPTNYHSTSLTDDKTDEYINNTLRKIQRLYNFTWMIQEVERSTVDGTRKYSLPTASDATWAEVESGTVRKFKDEIATELVSSENSRTKLRKRLRKAIEEDAKFVDLDDSGTPSDYAVEQEYLWLYHKPNDTGWTMNMEFYGYLPDLSGDTDTNKVTDDFPEVLEYGATAQGFRFGHDIEMAEYWESRMKEVLAEMVDADITRELASVESGMEPEAGAGVGDMD